MGDEAMEQERSVRQVFKAPETVEGAGVRLHRVFGYSEVPLFDPFLMLDDFRAERPEDYLAGFPWHPHRGIETVTYMLEGNVEHGDSMGNAGIVGPGCIPWKTAGSGIIHHRRCPNRLVAGWGVSSSGSTCRLSAR